MTKNRFIWMILLIIMLAFTGCTNDNAADKATEATTDAREIEPLNIKVVAPEGTPTLSMVKMLIENPQITDNAIVEYESLQSTDVLAATLINNEADIAIVPTNLAAVLHSKGVGYKLVGSSIWGVLYVVTSENVSTVEDLVGREVTLVGRNLTPDAVFRYILTEKGIDPDKDLTLEYFSGNSELAADYISGGSDLAMISEPVLTNVLSKRTDSSVVLDLQKEWSELTGLNSYPQASLIISEALIKEQPEFVASFIATYSEAVEWVVANPLKAGEYYESLGLGLNAAIIEKAIPRCNFNFIPVAEGKDAVSKYLDVLYNFNPQLTGGVAPDETLYYE